MQSKYNGIGKTNSFEKIEIDYLKAEMEKLRTKWQILISVAFAPDRHFSETQTPFFMNLRREGVLA